MPAQPLIGRSEYIRLLNLVYTSNKPEFVTLIGRRRVGKTFLVRWVCARHLRFEPTTLFRYHTRTTKHLFTILIAPSGIVSNEHSP